MLARKLVLETRYHRGLARVVVVLDSTGGRVDSIAAVVDDAVLGDHGVVPLRLLQVRGRHLVELLRRRDVGSGRCVRRRLTLGVDGRQTEAHVRRR